MTRMIDTKSKRHLPAKLAAGLAISAFFVLATFVASASAENWDSQQRAEKNQRHRDDHRQWRRGDRGYDGDRGYYYGAPPVVYGSPGGYYGSPPPVVYGPGIGIGLPGVNINLW